MLRRNCLTSMCGCLVMCMYGNGYASMIHAHSGNRYMLVQICVCMCHKSHRGRGLRWSESMCKCAYSVGEGLNSANVKDRFLIGSKESKNWSFLAHCFKRTIMVIHPEDLSYQHTMKSHSLIRSHYEGLPAWPVLSNNRLLRSHLYADRGSTMNCAFRGTVMLIKQTVRDRVSVTVTLTLMVMEFSSPTPDPDQWPPRLEEILCHYYMLAWSCFMAIIEQLVFDTHTLMPSSYVTIYDDTPRLWVCWSHVGNALISRRPGMTNSLVVSEISHSRGTIMRSF